MWILRRDKKIERASLIWNDVREGRVVYHNPTVGQWSWQTKPNAICASRLDELQLTKCGITSDQRMLTNDIQTTGEESGI